MKKIFLFFVLFSLSFPVFAQDISFNLKSSLTLNENEGEVYLPVLEINLGDSLVKNFSFYISSSDYFIFGSNLSEIQTNLSDNKIEEVFLEDKNKTLKLTLDTVASGSLEISGIKIRTYDEEISGGRIGFDYDNDGQIDLYSTNSIELDEDNEQSETMKPLGVSDVEYSLEKSDDGTYNISITWTSGLDLDTVGTLITVNKNASYGNIQEQLIGKTSSQIFTYENMDLENDNYKITLYSKDSYFLSNDPYIIELDEDDLISDNLLSNTGSVVNTDTSSGTIVKNDNETGTIDDETKVNNIEKTEEEIEIIEEVEIEKYLPIFDREAFNNFMVKFDKKIDEKGYNREIRITRNEIIETLKDYENNEITKEFLIEELKRLVIEFKENW